MVTLLLVLLHHRLAPVGRGDHFKLIHFQNPRHQIPGMDLIIRQQDLGHNVPCILTLGR